MQMRLSANQQKIMKLSVSTDSMMTAMDLPTVQMIDVKAPPQLIPHPAV
jgi:hypothetical protein